MNMQGASHRRIFTAKFCPDSDLAFVTCGVKHIKFWTVTGTTMCGSKGILGGNKMPTMLSLAFGSANNASDAARSEEEVSSMIRYFF